MKAEIVRAEERAKEAEAVRDRAVTAIGNLVHDSVPVSNDEVDALTIVKHVLVCRAAAALQHQSTVHDDPCLIRHGHCMTSICVSTNAAHALAEFQSRVVRQ